MCRGGRAHIWHKACIHVRGQGHRVRSEDGTQALYLLSHLTRLPISSSKCSIYLLLDYLFSSETGSHYAALKLSAQTWMDQNSGARGIGARVTTPRLPFFLFKVVPRPPKPQKGQNHTAEDYATLCENTKGSACLGERMPSYLPQKGRARLDVVCFCGLRSQFRTHLERASG